MSFLLWHRDRNIALGSARLVLRASEVPLFADAQKLRDQLEKLTDEQAQHVAAAAEEARVKGYVEGREQGAIDARDEVAATLVELNTTATREREQLRGEIAGLALQVVRKLLGQLPADGVLAALAETATREMLPTQTLTLFVHPDQCDAVRARLSAAAATPDAPRFDVLSDPDRASDTCRIETEHGSIDASLDAQLSRLASAWGLTP
jgi:type III secretion protein L